ncbi:NlpC/P60 family protein [Arthrobacter jinronghuae]|uniref:C40 family peptidase n=1 Tax=Arthrobacter jinronghuae TaxID=2964609 RepID=A0ABT1NSI1_9MICC|nr:NlpC/P60 family protein [Arthrobacter jinronghuae]MCQ1950680.1 C40 family peptidase [Arthrobacter jinronghuae]MCQ1954003.1 C40 family peptidase [Arthrobacter sp. zg-Y238]UWX79154.1 C40 family peptidase [Arthrobacter jinronghuae]
MSSHAHGRRRAATVQTNPITALSKAVSSNAGTVGRQAAVVVAASGLVLAAGLPAQASSVSTDRQALAATPLNIVAGSVTAPANAPFELPLVAPSSTSGAEYRAQVAAEEAAAQAAEELAASQAAATQAAATKNAAAARTAPAASGPAVVAASSTSAAVEAPASGNVAAGLVASAYGQIGVAQDCTAMVENALRSVGKSVGDLAPGQFFQFGSVVSTPAPGDLVITGGHVAIYVGNGQVVSGGLNGMNTGLHALSDLPGASFVRVS